MFNFNSKKNKRIVSGIIISVIILAMLLSIVLPLYY